MARSTVHYADKETNNILKKLHNKLRPAGTPVQRVEYIIELLLLRIFEVKLVQDPEFEQLRGAFAGDNETLLFSSLLSLPNDQILVALNARFFPFYAHILSEARKVWKGNLSTKVQDQLILIEEVFGNSNFTNNVTSGNMAEIIGLVAELDSERLLKTDLLGDAIESALSETGGTKDIGLHRTPDHIRQFMVGLAAPTFKSRLFDPAVGTGGFMFDSFEYVLEGIYREGRWPGAKAHPELVAWFKDWFDRHPTELPSHEVTTDFYRTGVGGIEYLGMVRKMAAINFYVRGLNPGNIQQGDALEKFGTDILPGSKSIVIANPPFGAQRDKESYPNVWSEYSTESETTILFVKLMLETLEPRGVCAVIVSEGFLTWDQNSARALRRALLEDCNLQAIISLPQGLFVSKGGQGPKTSILLFVKGQPTERVWFYKVGNDGYTMGTNRKPVAGCQLVEALDLFHDHVRQGKEPPESRHSFCIPAEWIKTLDPRIKDRIRTETRADMAMKEADDRAKQLGKWNAQIAAKKLTPAERDERLSQHAELWFGKTENDIARKIERAHLYSFNLPNYRSSLSLAQIEAWKSFAATRVREGNGETTLEAKYRAVAAARTEELDEMLSSLDPRHTLELDWARQFLTGVPAAEFKKHPHLNTLQEVIASQQQTPRVQLKGMLEPVSRPVTFEKDRIYRRVTVKLYGKGVVLRDKVTVDDLKGDKWFRVKVGDLIFSKIDARHGSFGLIPEELDDAIVTSEFPTFTVKASDYDPVLLALILGDDRFYGQIEQKVSGATGRRRFEPTELLDMEIPLLNQDEQGRLISVFGKNSRFVRAAEQLDINWPIDDQCLDWDDKVTLGDCLTFVSSGSTPLGGEENYVGDGVLFIRSQNVLRGACDFSDAVYIPSEIHGSMARTVVRKDDVFLNITGASIGRSAVMEEEREANVNQHVAILRVDSKKLDPFYLCFVLNTDSIQRTIDTVQMGASRQGLNFSQIRELRIPICDLATQREIGTRFRHSLTIQNATRQLASDCKNSLSQLMAHIWES